MTRAIKASPIKGKRILYKVFHPIYGSDVVFDSWMTLCESTMDLATIEAHKRLGPQFEELVSEIADEMIETAKEYNEPKATNKKIKDTKESIS